MGEKTEKFLKKMHISGTKPIYIILFVGVMLMLFAGGHSPEKSEKPAQEPVFAEAEELEKIISQIKGAGSVEVLVTYVSGSEKSLAYETQKQETKQEGETQYSMSQKVVLADDAPVVVKNLNPEVKGVVVVAQGAGNVRVKKEIQDAVKTALNVAAHRVCVLEKK